MKNQLSQKITELRKQKGWSQKETAAKLGVSQAVLSHYEKGIRECGLDFLVKLSELYHCSTDYLFFLLHLTLIILPLICKSTLHF